VGLEILDSYLVVWPSPEDGKDWALDVGLFATFHLPVTFFVHGFELR
jgi:hypothetical protein